MPFQYALEGREPTTSRSLPQSTCVHVRPPSYLQARDVHHVTLFADAAAVPFYAAQDFSSGGLRAMGKAVHAPRPKEPLPISPI